MLRLALASAPLAAILLTAACAPPPPPPPPPPAFDAAVVGRGVAAALAALSKRSYSVAGCGGVEVQVVPEAEVTGAPPAATCSVRVARQRDGTWLVVVRSASQPGKPQARVTVSAGGEGAQHIDYGD